MLDPTISYNLWDSSMSTQGPKDGSFMLYRGTLHAQGHASLLKCNYASGFPFCCRKKQYSGDAIDLASHVEGVKRTTYETT